ncbi:hypothetical protein BJ742DRAFT_798640 [Cladochytrium replicatum]|nr:hypothetical protein BJ742DRAFT_798640 [Cladochytrium replicatum]
MDAKKPETDEGRSNGEDVDAKKEQATDIDSRKGTNWFSFMFAPRLAPDDSTNKENSSPFQSSTSATSPPLIFPSPSFSPPPQLPPRPQYGIRRASLSSLVAEYPNVAVRTLSHLPHRDLLRVSRVCRKWRIAALRLAELDQIRISLHFVDSRPQLTFDTFVDEWYKIDRVRLIVQLRGIPKPVGSELLVAKPGSLSGAELEFSTILVRQNRDARVEWAKAGWETKTLSRRTSPRSPLITPTTSPLPPPERVRLRIDFGQGNRLAWGIRPGRNLWTTQPDSIYGEKMILRIREDGRGIDVVSVPWNTVIERKESDTLSRWSPYSDSRYDVLKEICTSHSLQPDLIPPDTHPVVRELLSCPPRPDSFAAALRPLFEFWQHPTPTALPHPVIDLHDNVDPVAQQELVGLGLEAEYILQAAVENLNRISHRITMIESVHNAAAARQQQHSPVRSHSPDRRLSRDRTPAQRAPTPQPAPKPNDLVHNALVNPATFIAQHAFVNPATFIANSAVTLSTHVANTAQAAALVSATAFKSVVDKANEMVAELEGEIKTPPPQRNRSPTRPPVGGLISPSGVVVEDDPNEDVEGRKRRLKMADYLLEFNRAYFALRGAKVLLLVTGYKGRLASVSSEVVAGQEYSYVEMWAIYRHLSTWVLPVLVNRGE